MEIKKIDQFMQLSFVAIPEMSVDPVLGQMLGTPSQHVLSSKAGSLPPNFYRYWAKRFAPATSSSVVQIFPE